MKPLTSFSLPRDVDYRTFLRWWGSELSFLVPEPLVQWWRRRDNRVLLRVGDSGVDLCLRSAAGVRSLGQWPKEQEHEHAAALGALIAAEPESEGAEKRLLLADSRVLRRSVLLPAAARENVAQVIGFELDRYTPFKQGQLYYDARLRETLADGARIRVEFAAVPREPLDAILARLALAGFHPDRVDLELPGKELAPAGFNLLPERYRSRQNGLPLRLTQVLAVLLCLSLGAVGAVPILMDDSFVERLRDEVRSAGKAAKTVEAMREETEQLGKAAAFVLDKKLRQPPLVLVLEDLTERLPDDGWLNSMQIRDRRIEMQGQAKTASALIALLEDSPYLRNTTFLAPVTPDPVSKTERFRIGADIVGSLADAAPVESGPAPPVDGEDEEGTTDDAQ